MREGKRSSDMRKQRGWVVPVLCAAVTLLFFKMVLLMCYAPSSFMEPTLHKNSFILGLRLRGELKTGDIIIFRHNEEFLVKRIAASGGEEIERNEEMITVPNGCFYVLGDNAADSYDSRHWDEPLATEEEVEAVRLCQNGPKLVTFEKGTG